MSARALTHDDDPPITSWQTRRVRAVVRWYMERHHRRSTQAGMPEMFWDASRIGAFAVDPVAVQEQDEEAMFRMLVTCAMFQQKRDVEVMKILRGIDPEDVWQMTTAHTLVELTDASPCAHAKSADALRTACDLGKDADTKRGVCKTHPWAACFLKRHTELLRRWGYFGKVPAALALMVQEQGGSLGAVYRRAVREHPGDPRGAAKALEASLCMGWRVHKKIANLYLSAMANPDFFHDPPWAEGVDWAWFVCIDTNVMAFLDAIGYAGADDYDSRRRFIMRLSGRVELDAWDARLKAYNPRLVQQAMYLFMSTSNRRALPVDCMHSGVAACARCDVARRTICRSRAS